MHPTIYHHLLLQVCCIRSVSWAVTNQAVVFERRNWFFSSTSFFLYFSLISHLISGEWFSEKLPSLLLMFVVCVYVAYVCIEHYVCVCTLLRTTACISYLTFYWHYFSLQLIYFRFNKPFRSRKEKGEKGEKKKSFLRFAFMYFFLEGKMILCHNIFQALPPPSSPPTPHYR